MPKIVSFTRVFNEDDIIEAFVRHHAAHVDEMLFLDNGSTDRTIEILELLRDEGFVIRVFRNQAVSFDEISVNSWGYQMASQAMGADFVLLLDADEFLATPDSKPFAALLPSQAKALKLPLVDYGQIGEENEDEPVVPWRLRWRLRDSTGLHKVMVRGKIQNLLVGVGNYNAFVGAQELPAEPLQGTALAHYPYRSGWQAMQKWTIGRLKALASGAQAEFVSGHYTKLFETLRDRPQDILQADMAYYQSFPRSAAIEAPFAYLGGKLSYFQATDQKQKAIIGFMHYIEKLASQHGRLLDHSREARGLVENLNAQRVLIF